MDDAIQTETVKTDNKVLKAFRLWPGTIEHIERLARQLNMSQTDIIEAAVALYVQKQAEGRA